LRQRGNEPRFGSNESVTFDEGKRLINGTTSIITAPLKTGLGGFAAKKLISKGLDKLDDKNNTKEKGNSKSNDKSKKRPGGTPSF